MLRDRVGGPRHSEGRSLHPGDPPTAAVGTGASPPRLSLDPLSLVARGDGSGRCGWRGEAGHYTVPAAGRPQ